MTSFPLKTSNLKIRLRLKEGELEMALKERTFLEEAVVSLCVQPYFSCFLNSLLDTTYL